MTVGYSHPVSPILFDKISKCCYKNKIYDLYLYFVNSQRMFKSAIAFIVL